MNALWIVVAIGVFGAVATRMARAYKHVRPSGLGYVSRQWLEEHRLSQISDPQR
jgi:hypothetical protein